MKKIIFLAATVFCLQSGAQDLWKEILKDATKKAVDSLLDNGKSGSSDGKTGDQSGGQTGGKPGGKSGGQTGGKTGGQTGGQDQGQGSGQKDSTPTTEPAPADQSSPATITDDQQVKWSTKCPDYKIGYPDNWRANSEKAQSGNNCLYHKSYSTAQLKILIRRYKVDSTITLNDFLDKMKDDIKGSHPAGNYGETTQQVYSSGTTMVKRGQFDFEYQSDLGTTRGRMLAIPLVDGYYIWLYIGEAQLFQQYEPAANAILKSFAITPELLALKGAATSSGGNSGGTVDPTDPWNDGTTKKTQGSVKSQQQPVNTSTKKKADASAR